MRTIYEEFMLGTPREWLRKQSFYGAPCVMCDGFDRVSCKLTVSDLNGCLPPFPVVWIEYQSRDETCLAGSRFASAVHAASATQKSDGESVTTVIGTGFFRAADRETLEVGKWLVTLDSRGNPKRHPRFGSYVQKLVASDLSAEVRQAQARILEGMATDALYLFSLLHCRNVELVDGGFTDDGASKAEKVRDRRGRFAYKVLKVTVGKTRHYVLGRVSSGEHVNLPLHLVRGHFAHYTEDRPMFGRGGMSGKFWIPAHARGDIENGAVVKDYALVPRAEPQG